MTDLTLSEVFAQMHKEEGAYTAPVPVNWTQGRTAYGGFSASLMLEAAQREHPDLAPLRSALVNFTAPISEPPAITVDILRQGRNVTTLQATARQDGKVAAVATFSFGVAQESHISQDCPAPDAPPPTENDPFFPPNLKQLPIRFFGNFEAYLIDGHRPFTGGDRGYIRAWVRHRDEACRKTPSGLLNIADVLPPAVFSKATKLGPNSSMTWICNLLTEDLTTDDGWYMIESDLTAARDGYSSQVMRMWNTRGDLVVEGMQSVVIFV